MTYAECLMLFELLEKFTKDGKSSYAGAQQARELRKDVAMRLIEESK